ncbi:MAG: aspartate ammonia-lyase [Candidatus Coatesbacteria bacterium]|nr:aspartate ammonia-lyase [Candidatus Coatesbacteria bacterium]
MRTEKDLIGELQIDENVYWGIHTQRAIFNFKVSSIQVSKRLIHAIVLVKKACLLTNFYYSFIEEKTFKALELAIDEILDGNFDDQFPVDAFQGGAGTSTNMNVNEVIANRANEILGFRKGEYAVVNPLEHVNLHQSTNDVYPTALKIACIYGFRELSKKIADLQNVFQKKEKEFAHIVKIGRTELQEAVPITMGAEFSAFAEAFSRDRWRIFKCEERLRTVNIGGTAVGTGLSAPQEYIFLVIEKLREVTNLGISRADNLMGETSNVDPFVEVSGILKTHASNLIKISNDLRLMNMIDEIRLPQVQAGSSIMPGKVNPVIPEMIMQIGLKVISNDFLITEAASRGSLEINEFMPLLAHSILETIDLLINADDILEDYTSKIIANEDLCMKYFECSPTLITAFIPYIGYEKATEIIREFSDDEEISLRKFLENKLGKEIVEKVLSPFKLTALGYRRDD